MKDKIKWAKKLSKTSMLDTFDFSASELGVGEVEPGETPDEVYMQNVFSLQPKARWVRHRSRRTSAQNSSGGRRAGCLHLVPSHPRLPGSRTEMR